ncbi:MAG: hypothetical protein MI923_09800 [Phycisphaerales bacterium]|nr:hypothetical protein [Phycisphaerales bacterium]
MKSNVCDTIDTFVAAIPDGEHRMILVHRRRARRAGVRALARLASPPALRNRIDLIRDRETTFRFLCPSPKLSQRPSSRIPLAVLVVVQALSVTKGVPDGIEHGDLSPRLTPVSMLL